MLLLIPLVCFAHVSASDKVVWPIAVLFIIRTVYFGLLAGGQLQSESVNISQFSYLLLLCPRFLFSWSSVFVFVAAVVDLLIARLAALMPRLQLQTALDGGLTTRR